MDKIEHSMDENAEGPWRKYPLDDFVQAVKSRGGEAATPQIRDEVGCSPKTARRRMNELEDKGEVESHKIGSTLFWRLV